jgi:dihydroneopterin aldolase
LPPPFGEPDGTCLGPGKVALQVASSVRERWALPARRAVVWADEEACGLGHGYIGTEHLLLGLLRDEVTVRVLDALDIRSATVREQVIRVVGRCETGTGGRRPLTPRACRALELAEEEALRLGYGCAETGHILLGLVRESKGAAAQVLYKMGADEESVRREVARIPEDGRETEAGSVDRIASAPHVRRARTFQARVEGLVVNARCGVTDEERARTQTLRVDLDCFYEAGEGDELSETVDYGTMIEGVAELLQRKEFKLLEAGVRMVGEYVLDRFPPVWEVTVSVTKLNVPIEREVSEVSVEATFRR